MDITNAHPFLGWVRSQGNYQAPNRATKFLALPPARTPISSVVMATRMSPAAKLKRDAEREFLLSSLQCRYISDPEDLLIGSTGRAMMGAETGAGRYTYKSTENRTIHDRTLITVRTCRRFGRKMSTPGRLLPLCISPHTLIYDLVCPPAASRRGLMRTKTGRSGRRSRSAKTRDGCSCRAAPNRMQTDAALIKHY